MKPRAIVKIGTVISVALLCAGFILYFFSRLSDADRRKDFNLYTLVPPTATAVLATDDAGELTFEMRGYPYDGRGGSKLLASLAKCLDTLAVSESTWRMRRALVSFHEPNDERSQLLYCRIEAGERALIDRFIRESFSATYSFKVLEYKGRRIRIYPTSDGEFLSCYLTTDFFVLSFQEKLIEEVIEAECSKTSLAYDLGFAELGKWRKSPSATVVYARMERIGWMELDMKREREAICFSGAGGADTAFAFSDTLGMRVAEKTFVGEALPSTTFYFSRLGVRDWNAFLAGDGSREQMALGQEEDTLGYDRNFLYYLMENAGKELVSCLFLRGDSVTSPAAVAWIPIADGGVSERGFYALSTAARSKEGKRGDSDVSWLYTYDRAYPVYRLSSLALFSNLAGFGGRSSVYALCYKERLLFSPDKDALKLYVRAMERGNVMLGAPLYCEGMENVSDALRFMMATDLEEALKHSVCRLPFIPEILVRNADFFRHFTFLVQLGYGTDGQVSATVALKR